MELGSNKFKSAVGSCYFRIRASLSTSRGAPILLGHHPTTSHLSSRWRSDFLRCQLRRCCSCARLNSHRTLPLHHITATSNRSIPSIGYLTWFIRWTPITPLLKCFKLLPSLSVDTTQSRARQPLQTTNTESLPACQLASLPACRSAQQVDKERRIQPQGGPRSSIRTAATTSTGYDRLTAILTTSAIDRSGEHLTRRAPTGIQTRPTGAETSRTTHKRTRNRTASNKAHPNTTTTTLHTHARTHARTHLSDLPTLGLS